MGWMQFIDSMTGRLAWPIAAIVLAVAFKATIADLLGRLRRLTWGDKAAELTDVAEAKADVQEALDEASTPGDGTPGLRSSELERILQATTELGFKAGRNTNFVAAPQLKIVSGTDGKVFVVMDMPPTERHRKEPLPKWKGRSI